MHMSHKAQIAYLLEASLDRLLDSRRSEELPKPLAIYRSCLIAFNQGEAFAIKEQLLALSSTAKDPEERTIRALVELRLRLLENSCTADFLAQVQPLEKTPELWQGELSLLMASCYSPLAEHHKALEWLRNAVQGFRAIGAERKLLRAEMNIIVARSLIDPELRCLAEYFYIFRKAKKLKEWTTAATAMLNISREYQRVGAFRAALKICKRGIRYCDSNMGSQIYYLLIAHRAHLYLQLGRESEAEIDMEFIRISPHVEVRTAYQLLTEMQNRSSAGSNLPSEKIQLPNWRERIEEFRLQSSVKKKVTLSGLEEDLIQIVAEKSRDKFEICDRLFGSEVHPLVAENRLKNIIFRIRKKLPGLLVLENGKYSIADEAAAPAPRKKSS